MRHALILLPALLAACSGDKEPSPPPDLNLSANGVPVAPTPRPSPNATGPGTALGLTYLQLEDAELVDAAGLELAEVERIDADAAGTIGALIVELPDKRLVKVGLSGLTLVPDGDNWNLRTDLTPQRLASLPVVPR